MNTPASPALPWKFRALRLLAQDGAPRVFDSTALGQWLEGQGLSVPGRTLRRALNEWEGAALLTKAARGFYLNGQANPQPTLEEAAASIRAGAVVSLGTVLGRAGVLNNPTHWVTAVVPSDASSRPANEMESEGGSLFKFASMRPDLFAAPGTAFARDALEPYAAVPTATAEKALLDWLYVSSRGRGVNRWVLPASQDWDLDYLDSARLDRLAGAMGLEDELAQFKQGLEQSPRVRVRRTMR